MYFSLVLENENGERLDMTTTANQYMVLSISLDTFYSNKNYAARKI